MGGVENVVNSLPNIHHCTSAMPVFAGRPYPARLGLASLSVDADYAKWNSGDNSAVGKLFILHFRSQENATYHLEWWENLPRQVPPQA
jgi:hypothetical protein